MEENKMSKNLLCLDPGHNSPPNADTGCQGFGLREEDITLDICKRAKPLIESNGIDVLMTREGAYVAGGQNSLSDSLNARCDIANGAKADFTLSVHANAFNTQAYGTECHIFGLGGNAEKFANIIQPMMTQLFYDRKIKVSNFQMLRNTNMPAALLETAFLDNQGDNAKLADPNVRQQIAVIIAKSVCSYFGATYSEQSQQPTPPPTLAVMFRIILDSRQVSAVSSLDYAKNEVIKAVDSGLVTKGVVQRTDGVDVFTYTAKPIIQPTPTPLPPKHPVMGKSEITVEQAETYLHKINPNAPFYAQIYKEEAEIEGVRWDISFAQALKESNYFRFGGTALLEWNNFSGIGVTGAKYIQSEATETQFVDGVVQIKDVNGKDVGVKFASPRLGIKCQIQHLKAYSSIDTLVGSCIDPRFKYIQRGKVLYIEDYGSGVWASDTDNYGKKIWDIVSLMKNTVADLSLVKPVPIVIITESGAILLMRKILQLIIDFFSGK
jgi:N-acetylmuramoyl-L-alanine amidase